MKCNFISGRYLWIVNKSFPHYVTILVLQYRHVLNVIEGICLLFLSKRCRFVFKKSKKWLMRNFWIYLSCGQKYKHICTSYETEVKSCLALETRGNSYYGIVIWRQVATKITKDLLQIEEERERIPTYITGVLYTWTLMHSFYSEEHILQFLRAV